MAHLASQGQSRADRFLPLDGGVTRRRGGWVREAHSKISQLGLLEASTAGCSRPESSGVLPRAGKVLGAKVPPQSPQIWLLEDNSLLVWVSLAKGPEVSSGPGELRRASARTGV